MAAGATNNGYAGGRLPARYVDPAVDMAAYDRLPAGVRRLVSGMPLNVAAGSVEKQVEKLDEKRVEVALLALRPKLLAECRRLSEEACAR